jgi:hypothetical protein
LVGDVFGFVLVSAFSRPEYVSRGYLHQEFSMPMPWLSAAGEFIGRYFRKHYQSCSQSVEALLRTVAHAITVVPGSEASARALLGRSIMHKVWLLPFYPSSFFRL